MLYNNKEESTNYASRGSWLRLLNRKHVFMRAGSESFWEASNTTLCFPFMMAGKLAWASTACQKLSWLFASIQKYWLYLNVTSTASAKLLRSPRGKVTDSFKCGPRTRSVKVPGRVAANQFGDPKGGHVCNQRRMMLLKGKYCMKMENEHTETVHARYMKNFCVFQV